MPGKLFIVGTPIGNMEDITLRALRVLREADLIAAEDTRRTAQLLTRHGISTHSPPTEGSGGVGAFRLVSYHEFNEARRTPELLEKLRQGRTIALVSDAGMPTISDPGRRLIQAVLEANKASQDAPSVPTPNPSKEGNSRAALPSTGGAGGGFRDVKPRTENREPPIDIEIIPGPSAITAALVTSGLAGGSRVRRSLGEGGFLFYGFLPHKSAQRRKTLSTLHALRFTLVFFESPYRLIKSLTDMHELLGNRQAVVARELTKKFEEIIRGDLATILKKLENRSIKGEITVVIEGRSE